MKRDEKDPNVVELTDAEQVVHEWYVSLLDVGHGHYQAAEQMMLRTPVDGKTWELLNNQEFRNWLYGYKP